MKTRYLYATLLLALTFGAQAETMPGMAMEDMQTQQAAATATAEGTVKAIAPDRASITVAHGAVPTLRWPPMTMKFKITPEQSHGLTVGDRVTFDFRVDAGAASIVAIRRQ
ncbi:TPA: copper-binding protein [Pseudomonas aeruginosa]|nr:copper-binding protein [Pseudomonas aeruginosa]HBO6773990.1 heat-shock protein HtpX [Pseudomonas aeruginosa]